MHGGDGDAVGDTVRDVQIPYPGVDPGQLGDQLRLFRAAADHLVQEALNRGALDSFQVVAHAHVEDEPRLLRLSPAQPVPEQMDQDPGLEVLLKRLLQPQFLGPLAVVALVGHVDAGLGHVELVQDLNRLQLQVPGPGEPGRDDVLGHLGLGPSGRAQGGLQNLAVAADLEGVAPGRDKEKPFCNPEDSPGLFLLQDPVQEKPDIDRPEPVSAHAAPPLPVSGPSVPLRGYSLIFQLLFKEKMNCGIGDDGGKGLPHLHPPCRLRFFLKKQLASSSAGLPPVKAETLAGAVLTRGIVRPHPQPPLIRCAVGVTPPTAEAEHIYDNYSTSSPTACGPSPGPRSGPPPGPPGWAVAPPR